MYRVIVSTFADRASAADARDAFKSKYSTVRISRVPGCCIVSNNIRFYLIFD
jgi:hypothetical protein